MGQSNSSEVLEERIIKIQNISKDFIAQIFHGIVNDKELTQDSMVDLCNNLVDVIDKFTNHNQDAQLVQQEIGLSFLKETVPMLTEVLLRRNTAREHELSIAQVFLAVARLLAQPFTQDIIELCELRNILFLGTLPQNLRFIAPKDLRLPNTYYQQGITSMGPGFFNDFGRPNNIITPKEVINFWPDEWNKILSGNKAIGHYIQIYVENEKCWREGKVIGYRIEDDTHTILLDPLNSNNNNNNININDDSYDMNNEPSAMNKGAPIEIKTKEIRVNIATTRHNWSDSSNRHRLIIQPATKSPKKQLTLSDADIGNFVRVWWSKYQRSFYGKVIGYDAKSHQHAVIYEDGDIREYDMSTKAYELVDVTIERELLKAIESVGDNHAAAAKIVAKWHQNRRDNSDTISDSGKYSVDTTTSMQSYSGFSVTSSPSQSGASHISHTTNMSNTSMLSSDTQFVSRPLASQGFGLSYHHINVINAYFSEGGSDSIFHLLSDPTRPPPQGKILLLNLQFVYQMRHMLSTPSFRDMVWEIKEGVPYSLSRYEDAQFKDLVVTELVDIFSLLRELMSLTAASDKVSTMDQQLDELRLTLALKLLRCSQIQKRYLGLSMIKEVIDAIAPKIVIFTAKRIQYLISTKNGRYARDPTPNTTKQAGTVPTNASSSLSPSFGQTTLTVPDMLQWLVDNRIVEEIFGSSIHQDLASKSDLILVFMAHRKVLTEYHTDIIWQSCRGAHEAVVKVVHQLIMLIVPVLEPTLRMKFFSQISSVSVKEYNEALLYLIKSYTVQALLKIKDEASQSTNSTNESTSKANVTSNHEIVPSSSSSSSSIMVSGNGNSNSSNVHPSNIYPSNGNNSISTNYNTNSTSSTGQSGSREASQTVVSSSQTNSSSSSIVNTSQSNQNTIKPSDDSNINTMVEQSSVFSLSRKGLVVSAPPRLWMGFGVLWQFIQDPIISSFENQKSTSYVEDSLFDLAIQLLVELLQSEFMDEREKVMQRCLENIRIGISVPASLQLLRRTLATYATSVKSWFTVSRTSNSKALTISSQIEKFQKQEKLLDVLFMDIDRYHKTLVNQMIKTPSSSNLSNLTDIATQTNTALNASSTHHLPPRSGGLSPKPPTTQRPISSNHTGYNTGPSIGNSISTSSGRRIHSIDSNPLNDTRLLMNGKISRTSHIKGVSERLDFLKFILSRSSLSLNDHQVLMLWKAFGEGAVTIETFEKFIEWLDSLIARESKSYSILLQSLATDCDPMNPNLPSKLSFLYNDPMLSSQNNLGYGQHTNIPTTSSDNITEPPSDEVVASAFEENVLVRLFEQHMTKWLTHRDKLEYISRPSIATLSMKLFLLVNLSNRAIRVESDGVWFRMGPLSGLTVIWRLALDSTDIRISEAAITLIVELHHRTPPKFRGANQIRSYLMRLCFIQLSTAVQSLRTEDVNTTNGNSNVNSDGNSNSNSSSNGYGSNSSMLPDGTPSDSNAMNGKPMLSHTVSEKGPSFGQQTSRRRSKTAGEEHKNSSNGNSSNSNNINFNTNSNNTITTTNSISNGYNSSSSNSNSRVVLDGEGYPVTFQVSSNGSSNHRNNNVSNNNGNSNNSNNGSGNNFHSNSHTLPNRFPDTPAIAIAPGSDDWYDDGDSLIDSKVIATRITRLIALMRLFIQRFQKIPTQIYTIKVLAGREEAIAVTISMLSSETIGALRQKIANHFKEPSNAITLIRTNRPTNTIGRNNAIAPTAASSIGAMWSNTISERLEKDDITLKQAKFQSLEAVIAKKKELNTSGTGGTNNGSNSNNNNTSSNGSNGNGNGMVISSNGSHVAQYGTGEYGIGTQDFITPNELVTNILDILKPIQWLSFYSTSNPVLSSSTLSNTTLSNNIHNKQSVSSDNDLFTESYFPLQRRPESNLWISESSSFAGNTLVSDTNNNIIGQSNGSNINVSGNNSSNIGGGNSSIIISSNGIMSNGVISNQPQNSISQNGSVYDNIADSNEYLGQYLKKSPHHIDQLLEMLDGYLSAELLKAMPYQTNSNSNSNNNINFNRIVNSNYPSSSSSYGTITSGRGLNSGIGVGPMESGSVGSAILGSNTDLSSVIWEVIQSLPVHTDLLHQVKDLVNDTTGSAIRRLLDLSSPYRFLYTLQIVESLLDAAKAMAIQSITAKSSDLSLSQSPYSQVNSSNSSNISYNSSSGNMQSAVSKQLAKVAVDWSVKFLFLGGAEHIIQLLNDILIATIGYTKNNQTNLNSFSNSLDQSIDMSTQEQSTVQFEDKSSELNSDKKNYETNDSDSNNSNSINHHHHHHHHHHSEATILTITILIRILHRLLLLDPLYDKWHYNQRSNSSLILDAIFGGNHQKVPPGIVLACIDVKSLIHRLLDYTYITVVSYTMQKYPNHNFVTINNTSQLYTIRINPSQSNTILTNCSTIQSLVEHTLTLVFGLSFAVEEGLEAMLCYPLTLTHWIKTIALDIPYSNVRLGICRRIFESCANILCILCDASLVEKEKMPRLKLFNYLIDSVLSCLPNYDNSNVDNDISQKSNPSNQSMQYNAEQLYSLVATLISLQYIPSLILQIDSPIRRKTLSSEAIHVGTSNLSYHSREKLMLSNSPSPSDMNLLPISGSILTKTQIQKSMKFDFNQLYAIFVRILIGHKSSESFHSYEIDGTLLGTLRALLIFVTCDMNNSGHYGNVNMNGNINSNVNGNNSYNNSYGNRSNTMTPIRPSTPIGQSSSQGRPITPTGRPKSPTPGTETPTRLESNSMKFDKNTMKVEKKAIPFDIHDTITTISNDPNIIENNSKSMETESNSLQKELVIHSLIEHLYNRCLFPPDNLTLSDSSSNIEPNSSIDMGAACQVWETRNLAYAILFQLCRHSEENTKTLAQIISGYYSILPLSTSSIVTSETKTDITKDTTIESLTESTKPSVEESVVEVKKGSGKQQPMKGLTIESTKQQQPVKEMIRGSPKESKSLRMKTLNSSSSSSSSSSNTLSKSQSHGNLKTFSLSPSLITNNGDNSNNNGNKDAIVVNSSNTIESPLSPTQSIQSTSHSNRRLKHIHWNYNPNILAKDSDAFVGLVNQGGTCYMNSFLQQLYHVPEFCNAILSVSGNNDQSNGNLITNQTSILDNLDEDESGSDAFLFQLQVLFGYLRLSQKKFYDTMGFCKAFKDYDGQPISLIEQKDINEFAGMLFDKLESNPECKKVLGNTIQGKVVYKTKSLESSYRSEREESFYMITAEVKGKNSLLDSLDLLIAEELFSGDNKIEDEEAGRKVDAIRRCAIRDLPSTLIIHLKRFEFDLETMDRKKVNDLITFPMELDMFPYTEEGISMKEQRIHGNQGSSSSSTTTAVALDGQYDGSTGIFHGADQSQANVLDDDEEINRENSDDRENESELGYNYRNDDASDYGMRSYSPAQSPRRRSVTQITNTSTSMNTNTNINPSVRPHRSKSYYKYNLIGVVAHVGAIDRGHYYSFIKERQSQKWYEFNDRNVFPFSPEAIPNECFGGEETVTSAQGGQITRMKQNNAYLLLYERVKDTSSHLSSHNNLPTIHTKLLNPMISSNGMTKKSEEDEKSKNNSSSSSNSSNSNSNNLQLHLDTINTSQNDGIQNRPKSKSISDSIQSNKQISQQQQQSVLYPSHRVSNTWQLSNMSKRVLQAVWSENTEFQTDRYIYSGYHFRFMWQLLNSPAFNSMLTSASYRDGKYMPVIGSLVDEKATEIHIKADHVESGPSSHLFSVSNSSLMTTSTSGLNLSSINNAIYNSTDEYELSQATGLPNNPTVSPTLALLTLIGLKFTLEVVSSARAAHCLPIYIDRLFEIISIDSTGECANTIISELALPGKANSLAQKFYDPHQYNMDKKRPSLKSDRNSSTSSMMNMKSNSPKGTSGNNNSSNNSSSTKKSSQDMDYINEVCHPWLVLIFVHCPMTITVRAFAKLILCCVKKVRSKQKDIYLDYVKPSNTTIGSMANSSTTFTGSSATAATGNIPLGTFGSSLDSVTNAISAGIGSFADSIAETIGSSSLPSSTTREPRQTSNSVTSQSSVTGKEEIGQNFGQNTGQSNQYIDLIEKSNSPVTILCNRFLIICERIPLEDTIGRDGFHMLGGLLYHIALLGYEERVLLLKLQAIFRMVCSLLSINSSGTKIPSEDLVYSIQMISILVRTTAIRKPEARDSIPYDMTKRSPMIEPESLKLLESGQTIEILEPTDVQAFLNRVFLDDAIVISHQSITPALIHMCACRGPKELIRICEFLNERIEECVLSSKGTTQSTYRPYLKVLTELLMNAGDNLSLAFDTIVPNMLQKAELAAGRHGATDAEFTYSIFKFFHRIGTSSDNAQQIVLKYKDHWKKLRVKFGLVKRIGMPQYTTTSNSSSNNVTSPNTMNTMISSYSVSDNGGNMNAGVNGSGNAAKQDDLDPNKYKLED